MTDEPKWVVLGTFSNGLQADMVRQTVEAEEIPVLVRGNNAGIFGGAFQGPVVGGIQILVPAAALPRARELVDTGDW